MNNEYWKNPVKVTITTKCPQCHELFSRLVYSIEIAPYQALTLCPKCEINPVIMVSKTY
jgi:hypothetical protein